MRIWGYLNDTTAEGKDMKPLTLSSKTVLQVISTEGALTHKEIVKRVRFAPRTVRLALKNLKECDLIVEKANLHDMRQIIYQDRRIPVQKFWPDV